jgi:hypothetical protein
MIGIRLSGGCGPFFRISITRVAADGWRVLHDVFVTSSKLTRNAAPMFSILNV